MDGKRTKPATVTGVGPGIAFGLEMFRRTGCLRVDCLRAWRHVNESVGSSA